jgi:hypothetical protein
MRAWFLGLVVGLPALPALWAQNNPRLGYVFPAGGRQGTTLDVTVGGQFLTGVTNAYVSGRSVQATVIAYDRPLTPREVNDLREKLKELQEKRAAAFPNAARRFQPPESPPPTNTLPRGPWTVAERQLLAEIQSKLANFRKRQTNPALAETATLRLTIAPDAEPGPRELRLGTAAGLSNPRVFWVGQLPEFSPAASERETADVTRAVTLPAVLNGQLMPGRVDRFRFAARQGQRLVFMVSARDLIPYLADAVPGWFQATLTLRDAQGRELAYNDDYRFQPDPVLSYEVPADGDYVLEIRDALARGREDFIYRLAAGELPFLTGLFPLGGPAGDQTTVELTGWNLPVTSLTLDERNRSPGLEPVSLRNRDYVSNVLPFAVAAQPEGREQEPNDQPAQAQAVTLPLVINGRIDTPADRDVFRFQGRAGAEFVAEVQARRLGSPLDAVLRLTDAAGRQLAFNDDAEDKGAALTTHQADSYLHTTLPADGTYYVHLHDVQRRGGREYAYRLRLSPPQPDFELRLVPSSLNVRPGSSAPFTVHVLRRDGFTNAVTLALRGAPAGFTLAGASVPPGQTQVRLTLNAPPMSLAGPVSLSLEGRATIQGRLVVHTAVPADDLMQAFAYHHLVPAQEWKVAVAGRAPPRAALRLASQPPVRIPAGSTVRLRIAAPPRVLETRVHLELSEPPEGITLKEVLPDLAGAELVLGADAAKASPGLQGNLIVQAFAEGSGLPRAGRPRTNQRRLVLGYLPAIPFEVVGP